MCKDRSFTSSLPSTEASWDRQELVSLMVYLWYIRNDVHDIIGDITEILIRGGLPVNAVAEVLDYVLLYLRTWLT